LLILSLRLFFMPCTLCPACLSPAVQYVCPYHKFIYLLCSVPKQGAVRRCRSLCQPSKEIMASLFVNCMLLTCLCAAAIKLTSSHMCLTFTPIAFCAEWNVSRKEVLELVEVGLSHLELLFECSLAPCEMAKFVYCLPIFLYSY